MSNQDSAQTVSEEPAVQPVVETADQPSVTPESKSKADVILHPSSQRGYPPVGRIRRLAAFMIDLLLLTCISAVIGTLFRDALLGLGSYARLLTMGITWLYFSISQSRLTEGMTIGMLIMKIFVVGTDGKTISFKRSLLRSSILVLVLLINGWNLSFLDRLPVLATLLKIVYASLGCGLVYLWLFNQKTGQSLHDLITGTRVVKDMYEPYEEYPQTPRMHWMVIGAICLGWVVLSLGSSMLTLNNPMLNKIMPLYQALNQDPRFSHADVRTVTGRSIGGKTVNYLQITLFPREPMNEQKNIAIAQDILNRAAGYISLDDYDSITISMITSLDLAFYSWTQSWTYDPYNSQLGQ
jgi:uncharacterized RDD family membrane protein YckC